MGELADATLMRILREHPEIFESSAESVNKTGMVIYEAVLPENAPYFVWSFCQKLRTHFGLPPISEASTSIGIEKHFNQLRQLHATYQFVAENGFQRAYQWLPFFRKAVDETVTEYDQILEESKAPDNVSKLTRRSLLSGMTGALTAAPVSTDTLCTFIVGTAVVKDLKTPSNKGLEHIYRKLPASMYPQLGNNEEYLEQTEKETAQKCMLKLAEELLSLTKTHISGQVRSLKDSYSSMHQEASALRTSAGELRKSFSKIIEILHKPRSRDR
jgi:hypothetical protein